MSGKHIYPTSPAVLSMLRNCVIRVSQMAKCPGAHGSDDTFFMISGHFLGCLMSEEKNQWKVRVYLMSHLAVPVSALAPE